tara:strand:+ start:267 stop:497 length:231 start_codon:yes stop_codon:yes gene_type:complete
MIRGQPPYQPALRRQSVASPRIAEQVFAEKTSDAEICHYDAFIDKVPLEELWLEAKSGCHMTAVISYGIVEWQLRD